MAISKYNLSFSPCPNDCFIFEALVNGKIDTGDIVLTSQMEDVETLNKLAVSGKENCTKLSFHAFLNLTHYYKVLNSGSALGFNCGPLLIALPQTKKLLCQNPESISSMKVAIPGKLTTANLLSMLAFPKLTNKEEMLFSDIENAVLNGKCDLGLIIHENRFTYKEHGLEKIIDLGCWWEKFADQAIPLGAIAINRNIPYEHQIRIDRYVRESLLYAYSHRNETMLWVRKFAQEMNEEVMRQHIELYVNEQTLDLGEKGKTAIRKLFEEAFNLGITSEPPQDIFL